MFDLILPFGQVEIKMVELHIDKVPIFCKNFSG